MTTTTTQLPPFAPHPEDCLGHRNAEEKLVYVLKRQANNVNQYKCRDCWHDFIGAGQQAIRAHFGVPLVMANGKVEDLPKRQVCLKSSPESREQIREQLDQAGTRQRAKKPKALQEGLEDAEDA